MNKIKEMISTASSKREALQILESYRIFGTIHERTYQKGRELIRKEFEDSVPPKYSQKEQSSLEKPPI
jgi:hypothetical protein